MWRKKKGERKTKKTIAKKALKFIWNNEKGSKWLSNKWRNNIFRLPYDEKNCAQPQCQFKRFLHTVSFCWNPRNVRSQLLWKILFCSLAFHFTMLLCHATDMKQLLQDYVRPVLKICFNSKPDHCLNYLSGSFITLQMFFSMDLNMFIAGQTVPRHSSNPFHPFEHLMPVWILPIRMFYQNIWESTAKLTQSKSSRVAQEWQIVKISVIIKNVCM